MKALVVIIISLLLYSCTTCRVTSVENAEMYSSKGYETRVAVYRVGADGFWAGLGQWKYHAQAQVKMNEWKWVSTLGYISDSSTYTIRNNEIYYWQPAIYKAFLIQQNKYN